MAATARFIAPVPPRSARARGALGAVDTFSRACRTLVMRCERRSVSGATGRRRSRRDRRAPPSMERRQATAPCARRLSGGASWRRVVPAFSAGYAGRRWLGVRRRAGRLRGQTGSPESASRQRDGAWRAWRRRPTCARRDGGAGSAATRRRRGRGASTHGPSAAGRRGESRPRHTPQATDGRTRTARRRSRCVQRGRMRRRRSRRPCRDRRRRTRSERTRRPAAVLRSGKRWA